MKGKMKLSNGLKTEPALPNKNNELMGNLGNLGTDAANIIGAANKKSSQGLYSGIGSAIGSAANFVVPGLGQLLSPLLGGLGSIIGAKDDASKELNKHYASVNSTVNPYQLEKGGLVGTEDNAQYKGNSHEKGGINIDKNGLPVSHSNIEVEGDETVVELKLGGKKINYVFSNKLKI